MIKTAGINEEGLDRLILDLSDYAQQIMKNLYLIDNLMDNTGVFFQCEGGKKFREFYSKLKYSIPTIKNNILSYTNDLSRVKQKYQGAVDRIVSDLNRKENH